MRYWIAPVAALLLAACAPQEPIVIEIPVTRVVEVVVTATPNPAPVALPTPTAAPDMDAWLAANGYEYVTDVSDGSRRYRAAGMRLFLDVSPDSVLVHMAALNSGDFDPALRHVTRAMISLIEMHGYDAGPFEAALASPYQLPLVLQLPNYTVRVERGGVGPQGRVTFFP